MKLGMYKTKISKKYYPLLEEGYHHLKMYFEKVFDFEVLVSSYQLSYSNNLLLVDACTVKITGTRI